jgi:hypothetical protein
MPPRIASALLVGTLVCLLDPAHAAGQAVLAPAPTNAAAVAQTPIRVPSGERVLVEHGPDEEELEGTLLGVEGSALRIDVDGAETRVPLGDVHRVSARRGNKAMRGALWGGLAGAGLAVVSITLADESANRSRDLRRGALGLGIGVGVGAGIGALIPTYRLVFDRSECRCDPRIVSLDLRPVLSPERRAVSVVLGF